MKHGLKKLKIKGGKDANDMLMRKLATNFIEHGHMVTTEKKAKALKPFMEKIVEKSKENKESNKNYLQKFFTQKKYLTALFEQVGPALKDKQGGYVKIKTLNQRETDGAIMCKIEWSLPVVITWENKKNKPQKKADSHAEKAEKSA